MKLVLRQTLFDVVAQGLYCLKRQYIHLRGQWRMAWYQAQGYELLSHDAMAFGLASHRFLPSSYQNLLRQTERVVKSPPIITYSSSPKK